MNNDMVHIPDVPEGKSALAVLNHTGDTKVIWSRDNEDEVAVARDSFNKLKAKGFAVFKVDKKGDKEPEQYRGEFDPNIERLIMVPPLRGG